MKRKLSLIISALLSFSAVISLTGCNSEAEITNQTEQINISFSWWGNDTRNEYTIRAIEKFEKLHPDINVNCQYSEWSGYQTRNSVQMISDTEADVMQINYAWITQYSPDGKGYYDLYKLKDIIDFSNFSEDELIYGIKNDKLNAVPIALNTQTVYINQTIYEKYGLDIPKTWDDFFNAAKVMNGNNYPISMTSKSAWFFIISYVEQQTGRDIMDNNGMLHFTQDDIKMMLQFYCDLINNNVMPQVEYFDKLKIESGEYAGNLSWLSDASGYCGAAEKKGFKIVVADYTTSSNGLDGWYAKPATMYAISKNTSYPEEAGILLDFLLNSDEMAEQQGIEKGIPLSRSAQEYLEKNNKLDGLQYNAFLKMNDFSDQLDIISPYFENTNILSQFNSACNDALYEKEDIDILSRELYKAMLSSAFR